MLHIYFILLHVVFSFMEAIATTHCQIYYGPASLLVELLAVQNIRVIRRD